MGLLTVTARARRARAACHRPDLQSRITDHGWKHRQLCVHAQRVTRTVVAIRRGSSDVLRSESERSVASVGYYPYLPLAAIASPSSPSMHTLTVYNSAL